MNFDLKNYVKIYSSFVDNEICKETVLELKKL